MIDKRWLAGLLLVAGACGRPGASQAEVQRLASEETCDAVASFTRDAEDLKDAEREARITELFQASLRARPELAEAAESFLVAQTNGDPDKGAVFMEQLQNNCGIS